MPYFKFGTFLYPMLFLVGDGDFAQVSKNGSKVLLKGMTYSELEVCYYTIWFISHFPLRYYSLICSSCSKFH